MPKSLIYFCQANAEKNKYEYRHDFLMFSIYERKERKWFMLFPEKCHTMGIFLLRKRWHWLKLLK